MKITAEISLYPLQSDYKEQVIQFIKSMNQHGRLTIRTTAMSTYVVGEYDAVMQMLTVELRQLFEALPNCSLVFKIIPQDLGVEEGFLIFD